VRTLALDPATGDLAVSAGRLQTIEGVEAVRQRLQTRLRTWQGEVPWDTSIGVPYLSFLGQKGTETLAEATLREAILSAPGIIALDAFELVVDARRVARLTFRARATTGEVIDVQDFVAGTGAA
jgi:hypothetical protein